MASENDVPQTENPNSNQHNNELASVGNEPTVAVLEKTTRKDGADVDVRLDRAEDDRCNTTETLEGLASGTTGQVTDLVADLYTSVLSNGASGTSNSGVSSFGDYKNIRATAGPGHISDTVVPSSSSAPAPSHTQNTFSFKHFLKSGASTLQAPSSTVTSLDAPSSLTTTNIATSSLQSSTGARPKVPQSSSFSVSATTNSTMVGNLNAAMESTSSCTKMKRSPRFSSFDSQASLSGAASNANAAEEVLSNAGCSGGFRLHSLGSSSSNTANNNSIRSERHFVPCTFSQCDLELPSASPRHRLEAMEARPKRLSLAPSTKQRVRLEAHCFPGEFPGDAGPSRSTAGDFPATAAALPDFVQDHWMDSWCPDIQSIDNSSVCDFVQDLPGDGGTATNSAIVWCDEVVSKPVTNASATLDVANLVTDDSEAPTQRLPDFLSDGPIIHSSQRLADVAAGLPSNGMNSPEDSALKQQLSTLRLENERQKRELNEVRSAFTEQTRRVNDLERQLQELQRCASEHKKKSAAQNADENLEQSRCKQALAQAHVRKLKQQVKQLTTEVDCLRREKDALREEGAVGGCSINSNCDRRSTSRPDATTGSVGADGARVGSVLGNAIRPSRSQQISRDLLRAASNAENNLRQLLSGVDNLRQMAADIEQADLHLEYDVSPDLFSDFIDECEDYDAYQGGPAL